jgi:hypothetical protein
MPIARATGYPDYGGASKYIVPVFSSKTLKKFYESTVLSEICNTDYLGEIKNVGDTVTVRTEPDITIRDYVKGGTLQLERPESPAFDLVIKYAKYFNFALDDIDVKEFDLDMLDKWAANASLRMKIEIERELFSALALETLSRPISSYNKGTTAGKISRNINLGDISTNGIGVTNSNILELIVYAGQCLDEANIPNDGNRWMIIPAWMASKIRLSELRDASVSGLGQSTLLNGRIGKLADFTLYTSNLLPTGTDSSNNNCHYIFFGHKDALAFATQLTKTEKYRPQETFAEAIKGLQVYGFEIVQSDAIGKIVAYQA